MKGGTYMGDLRANIKVEFEMFGKTFKQDFWINYFPDDDTGVDRRITEWFSDCWDKFKKKYDEINFEARMKEVENQKYEEYKRLKVKFESKEVL
jgi:hypothetical protein